MAWPFCHIYHIPTDVIQPCEHPLLALFAQSRLMLPIHAADSWRANQVASSAAASSKPGMVMGMILASVPMVGKVLGESLV